MQQAMQARRWPARALLACGAFCLWAAANSGHAAAAGSGDPLVADNAAASPKDAHAWLSRIHRAATRGNYEGTLVFSAEGTMSSARVAHYAVGGQTYEELEALDGRQQRIVRRNNAVHTLWPQSRLAVVETRETLAALSATPQSIDPVALEQYSLRSEGPARVAGRDAEVILLQPRDDLRYAQRLWADRATGLLLRADVLAPAAAGAAQPGAPLPVLESTAFSEVLIGVKPQPRRLMQALQELEPAASSGAVKAAADSGRPGWRVQRQPQARTTLGAEGWVLEHPVPGFRLAGCVRRGMHAAAPDEPVLQAVFTDGLTHVSVFVEPYKAGVHGEPMQARHGATASAMMRRGERWVTIVGDVPLSTLMRFGDALVRQPR
ncbi:MAG: MucB/RseB C-terminal domain-containing protein [Rubrivivax sp.]